ncbi:hypothetical protein FQR65_LT20457 [Abscondita terminalis]|nr:hypothetical protein FQR65_LT20457 [Abscondita terminalis]
MPPSAAVPGLDCGRAKQAATAASAAFGRPVRGSRCGFRRAHGSRDDDTVPARAAGLVRASWLAASNASWRIAACARGAGERSEDVGIEVVRDHALDEVDDQQQDDREMSRPPRLAALANRPQHGFGERDQPAQHGRRRFRTDIRGSADHDHVENGSIALLGLSRKVTRISLATAKNRWRRIDILATHSLKASALGCSSDGRSAAIALQSGGRSCVGWTCIEPPASSKPGRSSTPSERSLPQQSRYLRRKIQRSAAGCSSLRLSRQPNRELAMMGSVPIWACHLGIRLCRIPIRFG